MNSLYMRLYVLTGAIAALPLLELELLDYLRGTEFLTLLSQGMIVPFITAILGAIVQAIMSGIFGVS